MSTWKQLASLMIAGGWAGLRASAREKVNQDAGVVLSGQLFALTLGLFSSAVLARSLGPEGLSIFAVIGVVIAVGGTIADFGLHRSAIRQIAAGVARDPEEAQRTAAVYTRLKLFSAICVAGFIFLLATPIAGLLNLPPASGPFLVRIGALAILATAFSNLVATLFHALRRFRPLTLIQSLNVGVMVTLMTLLWYWQRLTVASALMVGVLTALIAAMLGLYLLPSEWRDALARSRSWRTVTRRHLLSFSKWLWLSAILSIMASQIDLILVSRWLPRESAGIYALVLNLTFKVMIVDQTLNAVLLPRVSGLTHRQAYLAYVRRCLARSLTLSAALMLALPLARPFINAVYGQQFVAAVPVLYAMMAIVLFDLFANPLILLAFPLNKPRLLAASDLVRLLCLVAGALWLIPLWGLYGAIVAKLLAKLAGAAMTLSAVTLALWAGGPQMSEPAPDRDNPRIPLPPGST
jgi:O-antigen/teichoic acid export membrane protein